jgi:hypothetical protein
MAAAAAAMLSPNSQAGFVLIDSVLPGASTHAVPSNNDFQAQLASADVSEFFLGRSLSVTGANSGDTIEVDFLAAEAAYWNIFSFATVSISNQGNQSWAERDRGSVVAANGLQDFGFCSINVFACLSNGANDATQLGSFQSIGMYLSSDASTAWLLWDDSGANMDDDHDDLIVRLTYRSVPEPGTLTLLGLGLAGVAAFRRKRI